MALCLYDFSFSQIRDVFLRVNVAISEALVYISHIVGWIYFTAWSVVFYPQIYSNYKRKSVVGLNFDLIALCFVGFVMYNAFNMALFWNSGIQAEYFERFPRGLNPVLVNDVVFSFHTTIALVVVLLQCVIYEVCIHGSCLVLSEMNYIEFLSFVAWRTESF